MGLGGVRRTRFDWDGAVVAVTGASRGLGRAVAHAVSARGAKVGLIARSSDALAEVLRDIDGRGAIAPADVSDSAATTGAIAAVEAELGPIDVLVCNAGIGSYGTVGSVDAKTIEHMMATNFFGAVHAVLATVPGMIERGHGRIAVVASIAGHLGVPLEAAYSASKFAMVGWAEATGAELLRQGIVMSVVSPGPIATGFFEARGEPYRRRRPRPLPVEYVAD